MALHIFVHKFVTGTVMKEPMLYCSIDHGNRRDSITVKDLILHEFPIDLIVPGPDDRYRIFATCRYYNEA